MRSIYRFFALAAVLVVAGGYSAMTIADGDWDLPYQQSSDDASAATEETPPGSGEGKIHPEELEDLPNDQWLTENPYRGDPEAVKIGAGLYGTVGCKDCHGIGMVNGGLTPDLRKLGPEYDGLFLKRIRKGTSKGMPSFEPTLSQEAMWAIRSYIDVRWAQFNNSDAEWAQQEVFKQYKPEYLD